MSETQIKIVGDEQGWTAQVLHSDVYGVTSLATPTPRPTLDDVDLEVSRAIHESFDDIGIVHGEALRDAWRGQVAKARALA